MDISAHRDLRAVLGAGVWNRGDGSHGVIARIAMCSTCETAGLWQGSLCHSCLHFLHLLLKDSSLVHDLLSLQFRVPFSIHYFVNTSTFKSNSFCIHTSYSPLQFSRSQPLNFTIILISQHHNHVLPTKPNINSLLHQPLKRKLPAPLPPSQI
jgi:hypothetical protein